MWLAHPLNTAHIHMKLSTFTQTHSGESRFERWCQLQIDGEIEGVPPQILIKPIPDLLALFTDWKTCLNQEMVSFMLTRYEGKGTPEEQVWALFFQQLTNPGLVDLDRLALRFATKYVADWKGITDDQEQALPFSQDLFCMKVLPAINMWLIETVTQLSLDQKTQGMAEKKIS